MQLKWYLIIIFICALIGSISLSIIYQTSFFLILAMMFVGIIIIILINGLTAAICRMMPLNCADFNKKIYKVSKKEKNFYDKLKIKKWKEKVPEIGHFTGFRKNKINEPKNPEYIKRFLYEICYGQLGHFISMFTGFLLILIPWFDMFWLAMSLYIAIIAAILNLLPLMVLRYNSYTLLLILNRLQRQNKNS